MEQQKPIDLAKTSPIVCDSCGKNVFHEVLILRKESRFISGLTYDRTVPIPLYACIECSTIVEDTIPLPLKELIKSETEE